MMLVHVLYVFHRLVHRDVLSALILANANHAIMDFIFKIQQRYALFALLTAMRVQVTLIVMDVRQDTT